MENCKIIRMARAFNPTSRQAIAERLSVTQAALGLNQKQFAELAGISPQAMNNWMQASQGMSVEQAIRLCDAHGLTLDWIYRGIAAGLPYHIHVAINGDQRTA